MPYEMSCRNAVPICTSLPLKGDQLKFIGLPQSTNLGEKVVSEKEYLSAMAARPWGGKRAEVSNVQRSPRQIMNFRKRLRSWLLRERKENRGSSFAARQRHRIVCASTTLQLPIPG
jgi:hypothetical protein